VVVGQDNGRASAEQSLDCHGIREGGTGGGQEEPWLPDPANLPCNFSFFVQSDVGVDRLGTY
jgi:hypothetical protein